MPVTIYDVAKQAGVGVGTVSRVLNSNARVSPETRKRVLDVIGQLNFRPSPIAQRLSLRKTLSIGVVAVFFTRPSVVERLRGIEFVIADSEYDLIVHNIETPARRDAIFRDVAAGHRVDGLIVISLSPTDDDVGRWAGADVPVVLVDTSHPALHRVIVDDVAGGYLATEHLIGLGHRRIAFVGDPVHTAFNFTSSRHRLEGLRHALADHGITFRPEYHQTGEHGQETARVLTHTLLALDDPPIGRVCGQRYPGLWRHAGRTRARFPRAGGSLGDRLRRHRDGRIPQPDHHPPAFVRIRDSAGSSCC